VLSRSWDLRVAVQQLGPARCHTGASVAPAWRCAHRCACEMPDLAKASLGHLGRAASACLALQQTRVPCTGCLCACLTVWSVGASASCGRTGPPMCELLNCLTWKQVMCKCCVSGSVAAGLMPASSGARALLLTCTPPWWSSQAKGGWPDPHPRSPARANTSCVTAPVELTPRL